ncbi:MAG: TonB-dependent receptor domain-containing protein [Gemmatimonadaceae bacterium]
MRPSHHWASRRTLPSLRLALCVAVAVSVAPMVARAQSALDSASLGPGVRAPARFVGASRAVIDSLDVQRSSATTFSELLQARAASVGVMMSGGTLTDGGRVLIRGPSTVTTAGAPLLIVDGVRMDEQEDDSITTASRLDDIAIDDIATVEILRGPAAGALYGGGASSGIIIVTTKRGSTAGWQSRGRLRLDSRQASWHAPDSYERRGVNTFTGTPTTYCNLSVVASGGCQPTSLYVWNPVAAASPFRAGPGVRGSIDFGSASATHATRLSVSGRHANGIASDDRLSQLFTRLNASQHIVSGLDVELHASGVWGRSQRTALGQVIGLGLTAPASGDLARILADQMSVALERPLEQRMRHLSGGIDATWRPMAWLTLRGAITRDRVDADAGKGWEEPNPLAASAASYNLGGISDLTTFDYAYDRLSTRNASRGTVELVHRVPNVDGAEGRLILGTERTVRGHDMSQSSQVSYGPSLGSSSSLEFWGSSVNNSLFLTERVTLGERFALGAGVRRELDFRADSVWRFFPNADAVWRAPSALAGGALRLRMAYGESVQPFAMFESPTLPAPSTNFPRSPSQVDVPERMRELEGGADLEWGERGAVSLSAYSRRIDNVLLVTLTGLPFAVPGVTRRVDSHGIELDARARIVDRRSLRSVLRFVGATQRNRLVGAGIASGPNGLVVQAGAPIGAVTGATPRSADSNGDGILTRAEFTSRDFQADLRSSTPTFEGALHSTTTIGNRLTVTAVLDRRAGQYVRSASERIRCGRPNCRELQDPTATIADQAYALDVQSNLAFNSASFTRLREVTLRWTLTDARAQRRSVTAATVVVSGRDLATWTRWKGLDPEINTNLRSAGMQSDAGGVPLPRRLSIGVELGMGGR